GDNLKLLSVDQWGTNQWSSIERAFRGCSNLQILAADSPDLTLCTNAARSFQGCLSLNNDISGWDVSTITNFNSMFRSSGFNQPIGVWDMSNAISMKQMFDGAVSFDKDLSAWDVSSLTDATGMFAGVTLSTANYDALLIGWNSQTLQSGVTFDGGNSQYCQAIPDRSNIIATDGWTITDGGSPCLDFVTTWKTDNPGTSNSTSITIPTTGTGYLYDVDWNNDGTFDEFGITGSVTHDFGVAGIYTIRIQGSFPRIYFNNAGDRQKILSVDQWGTIAWDDFNSAFKGCSNLVVNAIDNPDLSNVTTLERAFQTTNVNGGFENWNTSSIINMQQMFTSSPNFNCDISSWDVSNIKNFGSMFQNTPFNQDIGVWNTSSAENMVLMFNNSPFNQDISGWDVSSVKWMSHMFNSNYVFNQDLSSWVTSSLVSVY
ncbi:BspA family leucine-rich repeat surface protein, partial [Vicingus serpentipes]